MVVVSHSEHFDCSAVLHIAENLIDCTDKSRLLKNQHQQTEKKKHLVDLFIKLLIKNTILDNLINLTIF